MNRRPTLRLTAVLLAIALASTACSSAGGLGGSDGEQELTFGMNTDFVSLDPAKGGGPATIQALSYEGITHVNPDGSIGPGLAESWEYVGEGNTKFEFTLRDDARFSDGTPVNAEAVKKWLEYFPTGNGPWATWLDIESIDTVDELTVRLNLATPNPLVPQILSDRHNWGAVAAPAAVENPELMTTQTVGAGPYVLDPDQSVTGDHYTYVPNEHYYDQSKIEFDKVIARIIVEPSTMLQAITTGQVQVAEGDLTTADAAESAGLDVVRAPLWWAGLVLMDRDGTIAEPLEDVRVRQALNYAIDREAITSALTGKYGAPTSQLLTRDGYDESYADFYPYDPEKAKSLLAEAGYADGFTLKLLTSGLQGNLGDPVARAMAGYLEEIGVTLDITKAVNRDQFFEERASKKYPALELAVGAGGMWMVYDILVGKTGPNNPFRVTDPVLEDLYQQALRAEDASSQWKAISRRMTEEAILAPVFTADSIYFVSEEIEGVELLENGPAFPVATDWSAK